MTNVYLEKIAEMLDKEAATRQQKKDRLKSINADQKSRTKANKVNRAESRAVSAASYAGAGGHSGVPSFEMAQPYSMGGSVHEPIHGTPHYMSTPEAPSSHIAMHLDSPTEIQGPHEGKRGAWGTVKHKYQSMSAGAQKKLKIGGAIGGALALGGAGYAAYKHEKAAEVALLINEGFSVDEAVALVGE